MFSIIFWGSGENFHGFSLVFQAIARKKLWGKITKKIRRPVNMTLNILLVTSKVDVKRGHGSRYKSVRLEICEKYFLPFP